MALDTKDLTPIRDWGSPRSGTVEVVKDHWWLVDDEGFPLLYKRHSRQCNASKEIAERVRDSCWPGMQVRFFHLVFVPVNLG